MAKNGNSGHPKRKWTWQEILVMPLVPVVILLLLLVAPPVLLYVHAREECWRRKFLRKWAPEGKRVLFVYSDSPRWKDHVEQEILPRIARHTVILKMTRRARREPPETMEASVWKHWGSSGNEDFPVAVVFPPKLRSNRAQVVAFYNAFRANRRGNSQPLRACEAERCSSTQLIRIKAGPPATRHVRRPRGKPRRA